MSKNNLLYFVKRPPFAKNSTQTPLENHVSFETDVAFYFIELPFSPGAGVIGVTGRAVVEIPGAVEMKRKYWKCMTITKMIII